MVKTLTPALLSAALIGLPSTLRAEASALRQLQSLASASEAEATPIPPLPSIAGARKGGTTTAFEKLRARFSQAARPAPMGLRLREKWTCYSLVNHKGEKNGAAIEEMVFDEFDGRILGRDPRAAGTLEFKPNASGLYAAYRGGRGGKMVVADVYRVEADGNLIRETSILYDTVFPLNHPAGINLTPALGIPAEDVDRLVGMKAASAVFSYGTCMRGR